MVPKSSSLVHGKPASLAAFVKLATGSPAGAAAARPTFTDGAPSKGKRDGLPSETPASFGELLDRVVHRSRRDARDDERPKCDSTDEDPEGPLAAEPLRGLDLAPPAVAARLDLGPPPEPLLEAAKSQAARSAEIAALAHLTVDAASFQGDGVRGIARLRFGRDARGGLAGATVTLQHDGEALSLTVEGLDDDAAAALRRRVGATD